MEAKERILVKTHELFNRFGIRSVSMDDIATQLGMSKKTLYQYYADKDSLVDAVFCISLDSSKESCSLCAKGGDNAIHEVFLSFDHVEEMLNGMNPSVLYDLQKYHPVSYKKFEDFRNGFLYKIIRTNLERGIKEELYRADIDVDVMTKFRIYSVTLSFNADVFPKTTKSNLVYIELQLMEHFIRGIATAKGEKLIQRYKAQRTKSGTVNKPA